MNTQVKDTRHAEDCSSIRRRRLCLQCDWRFTTFERIQPRDIVVIKSNGCRESFVRDKLAGSLYVALQKRPVGVECIENLVSTVVEHLEKSDCSEVRSEDIIETVLEFLRSLDFIAYARFALVHKNFCNSNNFKAIMSELSPDGHV
jgi:transcriptional repressor NrdR